MSASTFKLWVSVILIVGCTGCELVHVEGDTNEHVERTYPPALDLPMLGLSTARTSPDVPDSLNVDVRVAGINICPEGMRCFVPDGITIVEWHVDASKQDTLHLAVTQPNQFSVYQSYIMSFEVLNRIDKDSSEAETVNSLGLIGYSPTETVPAKSH
jgi:hypothetical protein